VWELVWKAIRQGVLGYGHSQEEDSTRKSHHSCSCMQRVGTFLVQHILGEEEAAGVEAGVIDFLVVAARVEPNCMDTMEELELAGLA
jgi:hypothetical protein